MPELVPAAPLTPEWHAARRQGVTATDIVTILGLSSWDSQYSLFWRKMNQVPDEPDNDRFRLGRELEPYIIARWREDCLPAEGLAPGGNSALYRSTVRPWQMATIDQPVWMHPDSGEDLPDSLLEGKSWADADRRAWDDGPPARVRAQVLWQMDVMDAAAGHVGVVFLPSGEFRSYTIEHDHALADEAVKILPSYSCPECADLSLMRYAGHEFYQRLRLELPPPDPDSSAATLAAVRARFAKVPAKQAEIEPALWLAWINYRDVMDRAEKEARAYEIQIREQAGEASELCVDGQVVARRIISDAKVKAHVRHQDYLRRVQQQGDDDA